MLHPSLPGFGRRQLTSSESNWYYAAESACTTMVHVDGLIKCYSPMNKALDGISLEVEKGEVFGLIGPNGAGKTTLIGCLLGLLRPDSGTIHICGLPPDMLSVRAITGYAPERPDCEYWMTARQFLEFHHGLSACDPKDRASDVRDALHLVELQSSVWDRRLKTFSRGMLQRLNLAQVVIGKPQLVFLDEPTLGLDPTGVAIVRGLVNEIRATGATAIINSHQLEEVERLCDRVAFIRQGKIGCIEQLHAGEVRNYSFYIKWLDNVPPQDSLRLLILACGESGAQLNWRNDHEARCTVKNRSSAAALLNKLAAAGLPIEEAFPDRMRLERLFDASETADRG